MTSNPALPAEKPKARARALAEELRRDAFGAPVIGDGGLGEDVACSLASAFPVANGSAPSGAAARDGRGDPEYWLDHGELTGELMSRIADEWGGDPALYRRVGRLHDVDYLAHPHDARGAVGNCHPVPLVLAMRSAGVHPAICLAVLEHAPYAELDKHPSSRLSAALSAAEDLATVAALDPEFSESDALSDLARRLLDEAKPGKFIRRDGPVRVESNVQRFVNGPLRMIEAGRFDFDV